MKGILMGIYYKKRWQKVQKLSTPEIRSKTGSNMVLPMDSSISTKKIRF